MHATLTVNVGIKEVTIPINLNLIKTWEVELIETFKVDDFSWQPGKKFIVDQDPFENGFVDITIYTGDTFRIPKKHFKVTGFKEVYKFQEGTNLRDLILTRLNT